jgi:chloramphenicol O-acetyltransferase type A
MQQTPFQSFIDYDPNFNKFSDSAANRISAVKNNPSLKNPPGRDDLLYMTAIPWVSFTSFTHPMSQHPADFIPRFAWGKYFEENGRLKIPLSVQGHHIFMDGIHMGKLYAHIEDCLNQPDLVLSR